MLRLLQKASVASGTSHRALRHPSRQAGWHHINCVRRTITTVQTLESWNVEKFREQAFTPQTPAILPAQDSALPTAVRKWFSYQPDINSNGGRNQSQAPGLDEAFWSRYSDLVVPLEITHAAADDTGDTDFDQMEGPLSLLFADLKPANDSTIQRYSVYLAQHDLRDLPRDIQDDLPVPGLVQHAGKGDLYSSSLWLGRSPTYTPLHRDPNPNLLMQLAGTKSIRLFRPEIGVAIFEYAQQLVDHQRIGNNSLPTPHPRSAAFRGEEMMKGVERRILHDLVWREVTNDAKNETILEHAQHATLHLGQALFIPKGWWHSVKGVGEGVTASANWWFR